MKWNQRVSSKRSLALARRAVAKPSRLIANRCHVEEREWYVVKEKIIEFVLDCKFNKIHESAKCRQWFIGLAPSRNSLSVFLTSVCQITYFLYIFGTVVDVGSWICLVRALHMPTCERLQRHRQRLFHDNILKHGRSALFLIRLGERLPNAF